MANLLRTSDRVFLDEADNAAIQLFDLSGE